ncbi:hypothetical protein I7V34_13740 [Bacillus sp. V3]|nr:hypothetical protein I7V34_13740 [Bacillus sp. V3]
MTQQWYNIGAFTFPGSWAAVIASFLLTFLFLFFWNRKAGDWYSNAVFYFILTWKLSIIIVDFQTVIKHPLTILYFHGGTTGYWLGIAVVLIYTFVKKENPYHAAAAWMLTVLVYEGVFDFLHGSYMTGGLQLAFNLILFFFLLKKISGADKRIWSIQILTIFTLAQLLLNAFGGFEIGTYLLTYITVSAVLLLLLIKQGGKSSE